MAANEPSEYKDLTAEELFGLLASLREDTSGEDGDSPRRRCCRWLLSSPAELHYEGPAGEEVTQFVEVRDISVQGLGLVCRDAVAVGVSGFLVLPHQEIRYKVPLKVAHCTGTPDAHRIGCQLLMPDMPVMRPMLDGAIPSDEELEGLSLP